MPPTNDFFQMGEPLEGWDDNRTVKVSVQEENGLYFGEHNDQDEPHGRGIALTPDGVVVLRYFWNGTRAVPGDYINIRLNEKQIRVGKRYVRNGKWFIKAKAYTLDKKVQEYEKEADVEGYDPFSSGS